MKRRKTPGRIRRITRKSFRTYYDEMVSLIRSLLGNALKTNDSLYFAVLTGCLRISKESIFTGLNNLKVHTLSDVRYDEYFGFTDKEVDEMLAFYDLSSYKDVIREWYDGYRFGNVDVYCPWDVINYWLILTLNRKITGRIPAETILSAACLRERIRPRGEKWNV